LFIVTSIMWFRSDVVFNSFTGIRFLSSYLYFWSFFLLRSLCVNFRFLCRVNSTILRRFLRSCLFFNSWSSYYYSWCCCPIRILITFFWNKIRFFTIVNRRRILRSCLFFLLTTIGKSLYFFIRPNKVPFSFRFISILNDSVSSF
jgi:hypothetical protein